MKRRGFLKGLFGTVLAVPVLTEGAAKPTGFVGTVSRDHWHKYIDNEAFSMFKSEAVDVDIKEYGMWTPYTADRMQKMKEKVAAKAYRNATHSEGPTLRPQDIKGRVVFKHPFRES